MSHGIKINQSAIRKLRREVQRQLDKESKRHPISMPIHADINPRIQQNRPLNQPPAVINNYHGPVVTNHGDHAQIAWDAENITQNSHHTENIAPGFEEFAERLTEILASVDGSNLEDGDKEKFRIIAEEVLHETTEEDPDPSVLSSGIDRLKGALAAICARSTAGNYSRISRVGTARYRVSFAADRFAAVLESR